jgi:hypothetical protein
MRVENWAFPTVVVECKRCERQKEWTRERFIREFHGMMLPDVLRKVAVGCDRLHRLSAVPCEAVYPQIASQPFEK